MHSRCDETRPVPAQPQQTCSRRRRRSSTAVPLASVVGSPVVPCPVRVRLASFPTEVRDVTVPPAHEVDESPSTKFSDGLAARDVDDDGPVSAALVATLRVAVERQSQQSVQLYIRRVDVTGAGMRHLEMTLATRRALGRVVEYVGPRMTTPWSVDRRRVRPLSTLLR